MRAEDSLETSCQLFKLSRTLGSSGQDDTGIDLKMRINTSEGRFSMKEVTAAVERGREGK